jgi:porin
MKKISFGLTSGFLIIGFLELENPTLAKPTHLSTMELQRELSAEAISLDPPSLPDTNPPKRQVLPQDFLPDPVPVVVTGEAEQSIAQVTSVSELSDVQPTDWAFQAVQSLVERYGCIEGYPDRTFRGNQAATRYELAAALSACLNQIGNRAATAEDLATLRQLQEEFGAELAILRRRVDSLEARAAELEVNDFSTTTKLSGQAIFAVNAGGETGERILNPNGAEIAAPDLNPTALYRVILDLNTSFTGTDLLKVRLFTGSNGVNDNATGVLEPDFGSVLDFSIKPSLDSELGLGRLYYTFSPLENLTVSLGPDIRITDYVDRNAYANLSFRDFSTLAFVNNYVLLPIYGPAAGAALDWKPGGGAFSVRAVYAAAGAGNISNQGAIRGLAPFIKLLYPAGGGDRGLFGDFYQGVIELEYAPTSAFGLRLQYSGGEVFDSRFEAFGANAELKLAPQLALFGRYGYSRYSKSAFRAITPNYWMAGISLRDLLVPGAFAGIAAGQPFIEGAVGNTAQTNVEAFYNFPLSDNLQITPLVQVVINPANQSANEPIVAGTFRMVFSF